MIRIENKETIKKSKFNLGQARFERLNDRLNDSEDLIIISRSRYKNSRLVDLFANIEMLFSESSGLLNKEQKKIVSKNIEKMKKNDIDIIYKKIKIKNNNVYFSYGKFIEKCFSILNYIRYSLQENGAYFQMAQIITPRSKKAEMKDQYLSNMKVSKDLCEDDE